MEVRVKLFASLRRGRFEVCSLKFGEGVLVRDVLSIPGIPEEDVSLIFVNGCAVEKCSLLKGKDHLAIFPPIGGG
jgi:sulfur-carrier protein